MPEESRILRFAASADAAQIAPLYAAYVRDTVISFEEEPPSPEKFARRIETVSATYPYLVCESGGQILGWAYASKMRERAAYRFNAETSVYVAPGAHSRGIGTGLYTALLGLLRELGYVGAYASIAMPNENSVRLHRKLGFRELGLWEKTGYKHGRWIDLLWMRKSLRDHCVPPEEPRAVSLSGLVIPAQPQSPDDDL